MIDKASPALAAVEHLVRQPRPTPVAAAMVGMLTLLQMSLSRYLFSRRTVAMAVLLACPSAICLMARHFDRSDRDLQAETAARWYFDGEFGIILNLLPAGLATLTALIFSAGLIHDEIEEQTLTYLLLRPIPRWGIFLAKMLAVAIAATLLTLCFIVLCYVCLFAGSPYWGDVFPKRIGIVCGAMTLAMFAYCSVFGLISIVAKRAMVLGVLYIVIVEIVLGLIPFVVREYTIQFHMRHLIVRWLNDVDHANKWGIKLAEDASLPQNVQVLVTTTIPTVAGSLQLLVGYTLVALTLGGLLMVAREFRMKTPAGQ